MGCYRRIFLFRCLGCFSYLCGWIRLVDKLCSTCFLYMRGHAFFHAPACFLYMLRHAFLLYMYLFGWLLRCSGLSSSLIGGLFLVRLVCLEAVCGRGGRLLRGYTIHTHTHTHTCTLTETLQKHGEICLYFACRRGRMQLTERWRLRIEWVSLAYLAVLVLDGPCVR